MTQDTEVFSTKKFKEWAKENVVLLKADFPRRSAVPANIKKQNDALLKQFNVTGFPTVLFIDAKGKEHGRFVGYGRGGGPDAWIKKAEGVLKKAK